MGPTRHKPRKTGSDPALMDRSLVALRCLYVGIPVELEGYVYHLGRSASGALQLHTEVLFDAEGEDEWGTPLENSFACPVDLDLSDFLTLAEDLSPEYVECLRSKLKKLEDK